VPPPLSLGNLLEILSVNELMNPGDKASILNFPSILGKPSPMITFTYSVFSQCHTYQDLIEEFVFCLKSFYSFYQGKGQSQCQLVP
jgi:hypothetical protein